MLHPEVGSLDVDYGKYGICGSSILPLEGIKSIMCGKYCGVIRASCSL